MIGLFGSLFRDPGSPVSFNHALKTKKATLTIYFIDDKSLGSVLIPDMFKEFQEFLKRKYQIEAEVNLTPPPAWAATSEGLLRGMKSAPDATWHSKFYVLTTERTSNQNMTNAVLDLPCFLISSKDVPFIEAPEATVQNLSGVTAFATKGSFSEKFLISLQQKYRVDFTIRHAATEDEIVNSIRNPRSVVYATYNQVLKIVQHRIPFTNHSMFQSWNSGGFIMSDQNSWKKPFNEFLTSYTRSSKFKESILKHLGQPTYDLLDICSH